jgi:hypothetical protein
MSHIDAPQLVTFAPKMTTPGDLTEHPLADTPIPENVMPHFHNNFRSSDVLCLQTNHGYRWRSLQSDQDINTSTPRMINDLSVCRSPPCTFLPFILGALHRTT